MTLTSVSISTLSALPALAVAVALVLLAQRMQRKRGALISAGVLLALHALVSIAWSSLLIAAPGDDAPIPIGSGAYEIINLAVRSVETGLLCGVLVLLLAAVISSAQNNPLQAAAPPFEQHAAGPQPFPQGPPPPGSPPQQFPQGPFPQGPPPPGGPPPHRGGGGGFPPPPGDPRHR